MRQVRVGLGGFLCLLFSVTNLGAAEVLQENWTRSVLQKSTQKKHREEISDSVFQRENKYEMHSRYDCKEFVTGEILFENSSQGVSLLVKQKSKYDYFSWGNCMEYRRIDFVQIDWRTTDPHFQQREFQRIWLGKIDLEKEKIIDFSKETRLDPRIIKFLADKMGGIYYLKKAHEKEKEAREMDRKSGFPVEEPQVLSCDTGEEVQLLVGPELRTYSQTWKLTKIDYAKDSRYESYAKDEKVGFMRSILPLQRFFGASDSLLKSIALAGGIGGAEYDALKLAALQKQSEVMDEERKFVESERARLLQIENLIALYDSAKTSA